MTATELANADAAVFRPADTVRRLEGRQVWPGARTWRDFRPLKRANELLAQRERFSDDAICVALHCTRLIPAGLSHEHAAHLERASTRACARAFPENGFVSSQRLRARRPARRASQCYGRRCFPAITSSTQTPIHCRSLPPTWQRQPLRRRPRLARRARPARPRHRSRRRRAALAPRARHRLRARVARGERRRHPPGLAARAAAGQCRPAARVRRARRPRRRPARPRYAGRRASPTARSSPRSRPSPRRPCAAAARWPMPTAR